MSRPATHISVRLARMLDKTSSPRGCWIWQGSAPHGYGQINDNGRIRLAHRVAWELEHGPIPDGMGVLHHCDQTFCCNPAHLFLGTQADNMRDMSAKGRHKHQRRPELAHGSLNVRSKLTEDDVRAIRQLCASGSITRRAVAARFGITPQNVTLIARGDTWRHV